MPDVRFAVNVLDEVRISLAHNTLSAAVSAAKANLKDHAAAELNHSAGTTKVPIDFHSEGKQRAWEDHVLSCPLDSLCRVESNPEAVVTILGNLGFVCNITESRNVCSHPLLREQHGFFSAADTLSLTRTLTAIFSQGKPSSFQDILFPSPWYPAKEKQKEYDEADDVDWDLRESKLYWAGSTTGGHATVENWRQFHRQRMYLLTHGGTEQQITLLQPPSTSHSDWVPYTLNMSSVESLFDTRITAVIQCDPPACDIQKEIFNVGEEHRDDLSRSYHYKFNLDLDGNSFSGRFCRILRSHRVPIKQTMFKEWHDDWLIPWAHYVPLSMEMTELPEMMRFLATTEEGLEISKPDRRGWRRVGEEGLETE